MYIAILGFVSIFVLYGINLLVQVTDDIGYTGSSYGKIIQIVVKDRWIIRLSEFMMAAMQIVICIGGVLFATKLVNFSMCVGKFEMLCNHNHLIAMLSFVISAPTYFVKDLKFFSNFTFVSTTIVLILITCMSWKAITILAVRGPAVKSQINWKKIPSTFSVVSYALEGIGMVIPVKNSMENQKSFWNLTLISVCVVTVLYAIPTAILSSAFGNGTNQIVISNFIEFSPLIHALGLTYIGCIFMTYPLNLFPVYTIMLNSKWSRDYIGPNNTEVNPSRQNKIKNVLIASRLICLSIIFMVTTTGPNLIPFLSIAGAIFVAAFGYFFPVLLYNTHFGRLGLLSTSRKLMNYFFLLIMGGISVFTVMDSVRNLFGGNGGTLH
jgi:Transmembrane amino acid transporter protein